MTNHLSYGMAFLGLGQPPSRKSLLGYRWQHSLLRWPMLIHWQRMCHPGQIRWSLETVCPKEFPPLQLIALLPPPWPLVSGLRSEPYPAAICHPQAWRTSFSVLYPVHKCISCSPMDEVLGQPNKSMVRELVVR